MNLAQITKPYAYVKECDKVLVEVPVVPMLRVYRDAPDAIALQIRYHGGILAFGRGVPRNMIAGVSLSVDEAKTLRDTLDAFIVDSYRAAGYSVR